MDKKKNYKKLFPAFRMSNTTFQIKDLDGALKPGQKVLISQETNEPILHFATGKEIGKVEHKLGIGKVIVDKKSKGTVIVQIGDGKPTTFSLHTKPRISPNTAAGVDKMQILRITSVKGSTLPKRFRKKINKRYIAKIIE